MFKEKENVPAMSIAALERKYHCVIEIKDKNEQNTAAAEQHRYAGIVIVITNKDVQSHLAVFEV